MADRQSVLTSVIPSRSPKASAGRGLRPHNATTSTRAWRSAVAYPSPAQPVPITIPRSIVRLLVIAAMRPAPSRPLTDYGPG